MDTSVQLTIVAILIAAAVLYIARSLWKSLFGKATPGCGAGCGKCAAIPATKPEGRFPLPQL
jgi:hypothetical protein